MCYLLEFPETSCLSPRELRVPVTNSVSLTLPHCFLRFLFLDTTHTLPLFPLTISPLHTMMISRGGIPKLFRVVTLHYERP